jgi:hypothetical protein
MVGEVPNYPAVTPAKAGVEGQPLKRLLWMAAFAGLTIPIIL